MKKLIAILTALVTLTACGSAKEEKDVKDLSSETAVSVEAETTSTTLAEENIMATQAAITESVAETTDAEKSEESTTALQETAAENITDATAFPDEMTTADTEEEEYKTAWEVSQKGMEAMKKARTKNRLSKNLPMKFLKKKQRKLNLYQWNTLRKTLKD